MTNLARHSFFASVLAMSAFAGCIPADDDPPPDDPPGDPAIARQRGIVVARTFATAASSPMKFGEGFGGSTGEAVASSPDGGGTEAAEMALEDEVAMVGSCVGLTWNGILSATLTFSDCVLPNGTTVDGDLSLALVLSPPSMTAHATALRIDDTTLDGSLTLRLPPANTTDPVVVETDLSIANTDTSLDMDAVQLTFATNAIVLGGSGSVTSPMFVASTTATGVTLELGTCLPSRGTLDFTTPGASGRIEFLPTTPLDGAVMITIPPLPPVRVVAFPPCP
jgi:hypothetical protein